MRQFLLVTIFATLLALPTPTHAIRKAPEGFTLIEEQPEGELRIYTRNGKTLREKGYDDGSVEYLLGTQTDNINIVFADDGSVYLQRPVSESYYEGWVKGTLSADGKTITVPVGQYTAYTKSFDMAVQIWLMCYSEEANTYVIDESAKNIIYTIAADGSICLQGTDEDHILASVNRAFGETFSYLDFEWHGDGDYETVYTPADIELPEPPENLKTQTLYATTGVMDGIEWDVYDETMALGFDGDDVWLQGFTKFQPKSWVKGRRDGNTITFPSGQELGLYFNRMVYMVGAKADDKGNPVTTDIVFTYDGNGTYTSYTDMFVSTTKDDINYVVYYMGMTLSDHADQVVEVPEGLQPESYTLAYEEPDDNGRLKKKSHKVEIAIDAENSLLYIKGITPLLPNAFIAGAVGTDGVTFSSPQFLGNYTDETTGKFPIFFQAYDGQSGELKPEIAFTYNATTRALTAPTATIGIGINKTGLLGLQNMYNVTLTPDNPQGIVTVHDGQPTPHSGLYDLQGRRLQQSPTAPLPYNIYIKDGKKIMRK